MNKKTAKITYNLSTQWNLCCNILSKEKQAVIYTDYSYNYQGKGGIGLLIETANYQMIYSCFYCSLSECPVDDG